MKYAIAAAALASAVVASPQGGAVTAQIPPQGGSPSGCSSSYSGSFTFNTVNITGSAKRDLEERQVACGGEGSLTLSLNNGILLDAKGRTGYIASNYQFQFDSPPQAGAIFTSGWSLCGNSSLALGPNAVFWNCLSGTFSNIYDESLGGQCHQVTIDTIPCSGSSPPVTVASSQPTPAPTNQNIQTQMMTSVPASVVASTVPLSTAPTKPASGNNTAPANTVKPTPAASPSAFTGGASAMEMGQKLLGLAAAVGAYALF